MHNHCGRFDPHVSSLFSGVGIASMGVMRPELVMKSIVPVVMAGVLGIYGLIIAVIISTGVVPPGGALPLSSDKRKSVVLIVTLRMLLIFRREARCAV